VRTNFFRILLAVEQVVSANSRFSNEPLHQIFAEARRVIYGKSYVFIEMEHFNALPIDAWHSARIIARWRFSARLLQFLTAMPGIDWQRVEMFHLDEYIGLSINHPASFRKYLMEAVRWEKREFADTTCSTASKIRKKSFAQWAALRSAPIDLAFVVSVKMATWRSTILRPISIPMNPT